MKLFELFGLDDEEQEASNAMLDDKVKYIKDVIMYMKISNIHKIQTSNVLRELKKRGIEIDFNELSKILVDDLKIVDDMNTNTVTIKQKGGKVDGEPVQDSRGKVEQMAQKARERRDAQ